MANACHDCHVEPGEYHDPGCDAEQCEQCGGQRISCGCEWLENPHPDMKWTGETYGLEQCREFGLWCYEIENHQTVPCDKTHPGASENLNRLNEFQGFLWDKETHRWERW